MRLLLFMLFMGFAFSSCFDKKDTADAAPSADIANKLAYDSVYQTNKYDNGKKESEGWLVNNKQTGNWKYYNTQNKLERVAYYHKGRKLAQGDVNDYTMHSQRSGELLMMVPESWELTISDSVDMQFMVAKVTDMIGVYPALVYNNSYDLVPGKPLKRYAQEITGMLRDFGYRQKVLQERPLKISGHNAYEMLLIADSLNITEGYLITAIESKKAVYTITCHAVETKDRNFLKYLGVFQEMTESVNFRE